MDDKQKFLYQVGNEEFFNMVTLSIDKINEKVNKNGPSDKLKHVSKDNAVQEFKNKYATAADFAPIMVKKTPFLQSDVIPSLSAGDRTKLLFLRYIEDIINARIGNKPDISAAKSTSHPVKQSKSQRLNEYEFRMGDGDTHKVEIVDTSSEDDTLQIRVIEESQDEPTDTYTDKQAGEPTANIAKARAKIDKLEIAEFKKITGTDNSGKIAPAGSERAKGRATSYDGPSRIETIIEWKSPDRKRHRVVLFGSWNGFKGGAELEYQGNQVFACTVKLPLGTHVYRFHIDGTQWKINNIGPKTSRDDIEYNQITIAEDSNEEEEDDFNEDGDEQENKDDEDRGNATLMRADGKITMGNEENGTYNDDATLRKQAALARVANSAPSASFIGGNNSAMIASSSNIPQPDSMLITRAPTLIERTTTYGIEHADKYPNCQNIIGFIFMCISFFLGCGTAGIILSIVIGIFTFIFIIAMCAKKKSNGDYESYEFAVDVVMTLAQFCLIVSQQFVCLFDQKEETIYQVCVIGVSLLLLITGLYYKWKKKAKSNNKSNPFN